MDDRIVVACNYRNSTKSVPSGARAYVVLTNPGGGNDRIVVLARSRSGRWIEKWENTRNLCHFRTKHMVPEDPLYHNSRILDVDAEVVARTLSGQSLWNLRKMISRTAAEGG